jgi:hypothetical protein
VGGLAHYLEQEGLSTTHISLIREHTEAIRPPRALWVPFELGRPLGIPNDPVFQTRVVVHALRLLEAEEGPVLEAFPEDAPIGDDPAGRLACPADFAQPAPSRNGMEALLAAFDREVSQLRNWYDLAVEKQGRTTAGLTGLTPEGTAAFLSDFIRGDRSFNPVAGTSLAMALRMAAEDLRAYYYEAVAAQPGQPTGSITLANWFWTQTTAGSIIKKIRKICLTIADEEFQLLGNLLLVPRSQLY